MPNQSKITLFVLLICAFFACNVVTAKAYNISKLTVIQIDSLIQEKTINNNMTKLELLVLYQNAWDNKHADSINIFKKLAILNAELEQPKDALFFTEKYIKNTLDFAVLNNGAYDFINETNEYNELSGKYLPKINVLTFLYFCVSLIGFFFTVIINFNKSVNKEVKVFLGAFVGALSLFILEFVLYISNLQYEFPHTYLMASGTVLLFGPTLYFYFKSVIKEYKFKAIDALHFLPVVVVLMLLSPIYLSTNSEKINMILGINLNYKNLVFGIFISKIISLVIYVYITGKMQFKFDNKSEKLIGKWMKVVYIMLIAYVIFYSINGIYAYVSLGAFSTYMSYIHVGILTILIIYISYTAYMQPNMFRNDNSSVKKIFGDNKYKKSGLTESLSNELKENLISLLVKEEVYKESNINLEILSKKLNTTRHNTSQIINEHFDMNFFELINKFRIKEAIRILENNVHGSLNIIDIAYEVGYNNKVTFNKAFKKETSLTPSEYLNSKIINNHE